MNKIVSLVLLILGVVALIYGFAASDSLGSHFSRFFTGSPTNRTVWLMIGGVVGVAAGLTGLLRGGKSS